jgi:parallel beta-helix repeat protein
MKKKYVLVLLLVLFISVSANAKTFYVRNDGNNNCNGQYDAAGSTGNCAWSTLQHAADTVVAGDTVYVRDGNYAGFMIQTAGTQAGPITFKAQNNGANITSKNSSTNDGINIESWGSVQANYIIIDGFNVSGVSRMGIRAISGTGIIIQNCIVHNNGDCGIFSGDTPHISVLNNTCYSNGSTGLQHNIYISNAESDYPIVRGNTVYSAGGGNGIQLNGDWQEGGDGYIDYAIVENNKVYNNKGKGFSLISIRYGIIQNNLIYNNGSAAGGIHIVDQLGQNFSTGNVVVNNTIIEPNQATVRINSGSTNNVIFNNISIGGTGIAFEGSGNYQSNNYSSSSVGSLFVNTSAQDYHLSSGSAAIGYGLTSYQGKTAPTIDMDGNNRTVNYDAGAFEYGSSTLVVPGAPHLSISQ